MIEAPLPSNEAARLRTLLDLQVLDTEAEAEFDALVNLAAAICGVPISLVSLVDSDRQWFKANVGLTGATETPRAVAFCAHAIHSDEIFEVPDASADPRFAENPLVAGAPHIRFYAGTPLKMSDGTRAGTLCVIDRQPRVLGAAQRTALAYLGTAAARALEGRRALRSERQLRAEAVSASAVLINSVDAIVALTNEGLVTHWNAAAERLFGYTQGQMLGGTLEALFRPQDWQPGSSSAEAFVNAPHGLTYDAVYFHRSGEPIPVSVSLAPIRGPDGAVQGATKIIRDRRDQARAVQVLAESEARFKALSEASPLGVFATDLQGACTYTNERWQAIYGLTLEQSLGDGWAATLHPDDRAAVFTEWQRTATQGVDFDMEFSILRPDGQTRIVRARARGNSAGNGQVIAYVGSVEDITEQRATSARLVASEQRLRRLYESTPAMLHSIDPQGRLLTVSGQWLDTLGYTREEVIGRPSIDFMTEASRASATSKLPVLFAQGHYNDVPFQMVRKNGEVIDVLLSALLEYGADGQMLRAMAVVRNVTERLRAERALREERERLAATIDGTGAGTWEWNVQTGELKVNDRWAEIIGHRLAEISPTSIQTWLGRRHPDDVDRSDELLAQHLTGVSASYDCETRMRHRLGHWVWGHSCGRVMTRTADGKPEWIFGTRMDINDRKLQEEKLRKSEELLNRTGEMAQVGGWELDIASGVLIWSAQTRRIHGVEPGHQPQLAEAINFYAPEARPVIEAAVAKAMVDGQEWDLELPFIQQGGQRIWVRAVGQSVFEGGRPVRLVGAFQDITLSMLSRQALASTHERMSLATESGGIGVWEMNLQTGVLAWDALMYTLHGMPQGPGTDDYELWARQLHPEDRSRAERDFQEALDSGADFRSEFRVVWPDGSVHYLRACGKITRDAAGQAQRVVGVNWDVTLLRQSEEELQRSNEDLEQFAYVASHDLQEPLRMVANYCELLAKRYQGQLDEKADKYIHYAVDGARRMQRLVGDLLAYAHVGSNTRAFETVDIANVLADVKQSLRGVIEETSAVFDVSTMPLVSGDEAQLRQLFQNLVSNAIKFRGPDAPKIAIHAKQVAGRWLLTFSDNGIGIKMQYAERIFQMFQRLHAVGTYEGSGIGLAIAKRIVERHGGRIALDSTLGVGTTFGFSLPATAKAH